MANNRLKDFEPKDFKFDLFGSVWTVKFKPYCQAPDDDKIIFGYSNGQDREIVIGLNSHRHHKFSKEEVKLTLLHEIVHAIFGTGCYNNTSDDEPLVEWTARCISSLMKQNIL